MLSIFMYNLSSTQTVTSAHMEDLEVDGKLF